MYVCYIPPGIYWEFTLCEVGKTFTFSLWWTWKLYSCFGTVTEQRWAGQHSAKLPFHTGLLAQHPHCPSQAPVSGRGSCMGWPGPSSGLSNSISLESLSRNSCFRFERWCWSQLTYRTEMSWWIPNPSLLMSGISANFLKRCLFKDLPVQELRQMSAVGSPVCWGPWS